MQSIKSYTDIEQSKQLAEILPLESADMYYDRYGTPNVIDNIVTYKSIKTDKYQHLIPCWSLAALLGVLPNGIVMNKDSQNGRHHFSSTHAGTYVTADNPIDACYEMILKLNELKML